MNATMTSGENEHRTETTEQPADQRNDQELDLLRASDRYLHGRMAGASFDRLTYSYVSEYRAALSSLARARRREAAMRLVHALGEWLRRMEHVGRAGRA